MTQTQTDETDDIVRSINPGGSSSVVLVCEHASCVIPAEFEDLGLPVDLQKSHVVWDPGSMPVAEQLSAKLNAKLIAGGVSRLIYDCNRPPNAPDAIPARSEIIDVPGNAGLSPAQRDQRVKTYYSPFRAALSECLTGTDNPIVVTIHSFTPVYHGESRLVEIGILHDADTRLGDAMLNCAVQHTQARVLRNEPYGPLDGVTHTLKEHAVSSGFPNVMLEIRNDLIQTKEQQAQMGDMIAGWIADAFTQLNTKGVVECAD